MARARIFALAAGILGIVASVARRALAESPHNWQMGLDKAASPTMERITEFHDLLLVVITAIAVFVLGLLLYVMYRFAEKRNPTPTRTTHNTLIEILWTTIPVVILVVIAIPSFKLLYYADRVEDADMTIKAIGHQWYWSYEYPDNGNFTFDALLVPEEDLKEGQLRLLETDNHVVVPVNTKIRLLITADAVPGRINETWMEVTREGTFYGQCSEICGAGHAFMPIVVEAVSKERFDQWVEQAQKEFARVDEPETSVALTTAE